MQITKSQYLEVIKLLIMAEQNHKQLRAIEETLANHLGVEADETGYCGHVSDAIWSGELNGDRLLQKLNIGVEPDQE